MERGYDTIREGEELRRQAMGTDEIGKEKEKN